MGVEQFPILRNLAFYNGFQKNYFYFNSLETYKSENSEYQAAASRAAGDAKWALSILPSFAESSETLASDKIDKIISFLKTAIQYERDNEIAFFNNKIKELKSAKLEKIPEVSRLIAMMNSDSFKYDDFIPLINVIMQGVQNTLAIAKHEEERLKEVKQAMNSMQEASQKQLDGLWKSTKSKNIKDHYNNDYTEFIKSAEAKRQRRIMITYAQNGRVLTESTGGKARGRLLGAKKYLESITETADVKIAHWITNTVLNLLENPQTNAEIASLIQEKFKFDKVSQPDLEKAIQGKLIKAATVVATNHMSEILNGCYQDLSSTQIVELMQKSLQLTANLNIEGLYDNFGMFGQTLNIFKDASTKEEAAKNSAEALCDAYEKFRTEIGRIKKKSLLSKEQIITMKALKTGTTKDEYAEIYKLIRLLKALKKKLASDGAAAAATWANGPNKMNQFTNKEGEKISLNIIFTDGKLDIKALNKSLKQTAAWSKLGGRETRGKSIEGIISGIKDRTSRSIKQDLLEVIEPLTKIAQKQGIGGEKEVMAAIEKSLGRIKISVGGPTFSEIKQGIQSALNDFSGTKFWTGKLNRKNDFVTVTVDYQAPSFKKAIKTATSQYAQQITDSVDERLKLIEQKYAEELATYFYDELGKLKNNDPDFNNYEKNAEIFFKYVEEREAAMQRAATISREVDAEWAIYAKEAEAAGIESETINQQRQQVLESLQNSFFQSSTMKTYNQYQDNLGFVGGSLGGNLDYQLQNLNTIFRAAGMDLGADLDWIKTAIINCSPLSIVGEKYKNIIEDYLGSMVAFALFDEGAAEATILYELQKHRKKIAPKILHLYAVDGLYVPGSYVLQKVYNELIECKALAYKAYQVSNSGAGIAIINTMNEGMIPNRSVYLAGTHERKSQASIMLSLDTDPWGTIANKTNSHVSLKIFFLAGLMDIAHNIREKLSNIELPQ